MSTSYKIPHPIPYQGSKRSLAPEIIALSGRSVRCLYEPFAGSAAFTIAAAREGIASRFVISDTLEPLIDIWLLVLTEPAKLADRYEKIWLGHEGAGAEYYAMVRERFNKNHDPASLLYLLARCVKNSPRWNRDGMFNQSEDKRRLGMRPGKMRREIFGANNLLRGKSTAMVCDFEQVTAEATSRDLVYMDPPWQGTSGARDTRYHQGLSRDRLIVALEDMNRRGVPWLLSYDGSCGARQYGTPLPQNMATRLELNAGRSSQATLNGVAAETVESLYVSPAVSNSKQTPKQASLFGSERIAG